MIEVTLARLDGRWFPVTCCGVVYRNGRRFMEHFLPVHQRDGAPFDARQRWGGAVRAHRPTVVTPPD